MVTQASPLQWPAGWPRTLSPQDSRFGSSMSKPHIGLACDDIQLELTRFDARDIIISTNLNYKKDGMPYANQKQPSDKGAAVYFTKDGKQLVIACDTFNKIGCNLWAIKKTIEAIRGIDRWGCSEISNRAFTGFAALPSSDKPWWEILEVSRYDNPQTVKESYLRLSKLYYPKLSDSDDTHFKKITEAYEQFKATL